VPIGFRPPSLVPGSPFRSATWCAAVAEAGDRLLAFERRYEQAAAPFEWKFTGHDLALPMKKHTVQPGCQAAA
jgi:hypothetical protein